MFDSGEWNFVDFHHGIGWWWWVVSSHLSREVRGLCLVSKSLSLSLSLSLMFFVCLCLCEAIEMREYLPTTLVPLEMETMRV